MVVVDVARVSAGGDAVIGWLASIRDLVVGASASALHAEREHLGPRPGDVLVYGWWTDASGRRRPGHTGILSAVPGYAGPPPDSVIEARRWVGQGVYSLGAGGRDPQDGTPFDSTGRCDCSGFACHCLGIDRHSDALARWWNTTAIESDGRQPGGHWLPVPLYGVDLRRCSAIHCHGGQGPAVSETSATPWHGRGIVTRWAPQRHSV